MIIDGTRDLISSAILRRVAREAITLVAGLSVGETKHIEASLTAALVLDAAEAQEQATRALRTRDTILEASSSLLGWSLDQPDWGGNFWRSAQSSHREGELDKDTTEAAECSANRATGALGAPRMLIPQSIQDPSQQASHASAGEETVSNQDEQEEQDPLERRDAVTLRIKKKEEEEEEEVPLSFVAAPSITCLSIGLTTIACTQPRTCASQTSAHPW